MKLKDFINSDFTPNWTAFERAFPEMSTCNHSNRFHKEGSPLAHTKLVTKAMVDKLSSGDFDDDYKMVMLGSAMFHDIGKPSTTYWNAIESDWSCKDHGLVGELFFREKFLNEDIYLRESVAYMIKNHMVPHNILLKKENYRKNKYSELNGGIVPLSDLLVLWECDMLGSFSSLSETNEDRLNNINSKKDKLMNDIHELSSDYNEGPKFNSDTIDMIVMIGIPGAGKTYKANKIKDEYENLGKKIEIISRDQIRIDLGFCGENDKFVGDKKQENKVSSIVDQRIAKCINNKVNFIIDNTSLRKKYREHYKNLVSNHNVRVIYNYVEADNMDAVYARRNGQIDKDTIDNMFSSLEFPSKNECDILIIN